jgi:hypothetical protein
VVQQLVAVEGEVSPKVSPIQEGWEPELVVRPHGIEWHGIDRVPERVSFIGFGKIPTPLGAGVNRAVNAMPVGELKAQLACLDQTRRLQADFFARLTHRRLRSRLAGIDPPARSVNLAGAKTAFFTDEKHVGTLE